MPQHRRSALPRPFLKWAGGKTQLLDQFEPLYPPPGGIRRYLEPFLGSAAVFFHVRRLIKPVEAVLSDGNEELINAYRCIQTDPGKVIRQLTKHRNHHSAFHYYSTRARKTGKMSAVARAARFIYLNKTCFNGLYRVNGQGAFNVPIGRYKNPSILDPENLRSVADALRGVTLHVAHFREVVGRAEKGDFIYFDPPYHPLSPTSSFTSYTRTPFSARDQERLSEIYGELSRKGCRVMLSNSDCPFIRNLYRGYDLRKVKARRSINSRADRRGRISELVVLNYVPAFPGASLALPGGRQASSRL